MKETAAQSAKLKRAFKNHFAKEGYDTPLPDDLNTQRRWYPLEWSEACVEWEKYGEDA